VPSPIGHVLGGVAAAWAVDLVPGDRAWRTASADASWAARAGDGLTLACAILAAAPDLDLLFATHRTFTHGIGMVIFVGLLTAALAANGGRPIVRVASMCAAAYASHLLLDWLGADTSAPRGLQIFWPFDHGWYMSDLNVFRQTTRRDLWSAASMRANVIAIVQEIAVLGPTAVALWRVRVKALAGLAPKLTGRHHPPQ
jgi:membrane-bound metal-dependent hydrolase YbcI (DUF457 family)